MTTGKIGSADLAAGQNTQLGDPLNVSMTVNVMLCNRGAVPALVRIAIGADANPANADYIEYDVNLPASGGVLERTGIACSAGEKIWVRSDQDNVSARAHGLDNA